jgi:hypothetical protein
MEQKDINYPTVRSGIWRCHISGSSPRFRFNGTDYYTHLDIEIAHKEGLTTDLIIDGQPNFLAYPKETLLNGSQLFGEYIDWIYKLRCEHPDAKLFKPLISQIHGALAEKRRYTHNLKAEETGFCLDLGDREIEDYKFPEDDGTLTVKTFDINRMYKTNYARMFPFLLSYQKANIYNVVFSKYWDKIISFRTDGGVFSERIPEFDNNPIALGAVIPK